MTNESDRFESSEELAVIMTEMPNGGHILIDPLVNVKDYRNDVPGLRWSAPPGPMTVRKATEEEMSR